MRRAFSEDPLEENPLSVLPPFALIATATLFIGCVTIHRLRCKTRSLRTRPLNLGRTFTSSLGKVSGGASAGRVTTERIGLEQRQQAEPSQIGPRQRDARRRCQR